MNFKRFVAILMATALTLSLAACSGKAADTTETKAAETTKAAAETKAAATEAATEAASAEPVKLTVGLAKKANVTDYDNNALTKWIEETCNVDLEFVYFASDASEYQTQIATMMAANEKLPDIFFGITIPDDIRFEYDRNGYFVDMNQWMKDEEFMKDYDLYDVIESDIFTDSDRQLFYTKNINPDDGGWYHIGNVGKSTTDINYSQLHINKTWLDKLGLEVPTDFESLVEVLRAFRDQDPNGNGQADEIPMIGSVNTCEATTAWDDPTRWLINNWVFYNENYLFNASDGKLWLPAETNEYREALKNIKTLVDENLLSTMIYTISDTSELKSLYCPENGVQTAGVIAGHFSKVMVKDTPAIYEYVALTPFNYAPQNALNVYSTCMISSDCENQETAMRVILTMMSEEGSMRQRYGVPEEDWTVVNDEIDGHERMEVLNADAFSGQTDRTWASGSLCVNNVSMPWYCKTIELTDPVTDTSWADMKTYHNRDLAAKYAEQAAKTNPKEMVGQINLNSEENEKLGSIKTDYITFVRQTRSEFLTGVKDINSDADWNSYLDTCKALGSETLTEVYQSAYDRMK